MTPSIPEWSWSQTKLQQQFLQGPDGPDLNVFSHVSELLRGHTAWWLSAPVMKTLTLPLGSEIEQSHDLKHQALFF